METNPIIEELQAFAKLGWNAKQQDFFNQQASDAKAVEMSPVASVFSPEELKLIKTVVAPKKRQCYRNALLLAQLFPDKCKYVEGFGWSLIRIDHAFNRVGDKYVDITWELALNEDVTKYHYVSMIEADFEQVIEDIAKFDNFTGDYYRHKYIERLKTQHA